MSRFSTVLTALFCVFVFSGSVLGQDDPLYTRSELWEVNRQDWSRFVAEFERLDKPTLERLFAEGKISEWGIESFALHAPGEYTHGYFYSSNGMGPLTQAGNDWSEAIEKAGFTEHEFAPLVQSHRDQIFRNVRMRAKGGTYSDAFGFFAEFHVEPGHGGDYTEFWEERIQPRMEALLQGGQIIAYGLLAEEIQTREPTWRLNWYIAASAEGYDAGRRAFRASWQSMNQEERDALVQLYRSIVQEETLREGMSTLLHYQVTDK
jgi:hypothetical protein